jgi:outer membrane protein assembly factor BamD (BamD/ComL family)
MWTPTILVFDHDGIERRRLEGYFTRDEFRAQLELGLGRVAFMHKAWADAEARYAPIPERYPETHAAAEAVYWCGVSHYKATNDHTVLGQVAADLTSSYPTSIWAEKASVWAH